MLLTKAPAAAAPIPANLSAKPKPRILEPNWNSSLKRNERGLRLVVRGGYTRTPMETPGAYQLIDDDTGEKFIVWGGGSDDAPIPSKHTLSWKPSTANTLNEKEQNNSLDVARDTTTSITGNYYAQLLNFLLLNPPLFPTINLGRPQLWKLEGYGFERVTMEWSYILFIYFFNWGLLNEIDLLVLE